MLTLTLTLILPYPYPHPYPNLPNPISNPDPNPDRNNNPPTELQRCFYIAETFVRHAAVEERNVLDEVRVGIRGLCLCLGEGEC